MEIWVWAARNGKCILSQPKYPFYEACIQYLLRISIRSKDEKKEKIMPYKWKTTIDVDEAVVVIMNVLDKNPDLPNWLLMTLNGSIADSDKKMVKYFFEEVKKNAPSALKYFESRQ